MAERAEINHQWEPHSEAIRAKIKELTSQSEAAQSNVSNPAQIDIPALAPASPAQEQANAPKNLGKALAEWRSNRPTPTPEYRPINSLPIDVAVDAWNPAQNAEAPRTCIALDEFVPAAPVEENDEDQVENETHCARPQVVEAKKGPIKRAWNKIKSLFNRKRAENTPCHNDHQPVCKPAETVARCAPVKTPERNCVVPPKNLPTPPTPPTPPEGPAAEVEDTEVVEPAPTAAPRRGFFRRIGCLPQVLLLALAGLGVGHVLNQPQRNETVPFTYLDNAGNPHTIQVDVKDNVYENPDNNFGQKVLHDDRKSSVDGRAMADLAGYLVGDNPALQNFDPDNAFQVSEFWKEFNKNPDLNNRRLSDLKALAMQTRGHHGVTSSYERYANPNPTDGETSEVVADHFDTLPITNTQLGTHVAFQIPGFKFAGLNIGDQKVRFNLGLLEHNDKSPVNIDKFFSDLNLANSSKG